MNSIVEHTQLWWSVRPHHDFGTVEFRICDAQTRAEDSTALAGLIAACIAQAALDYDEGALPEPVPGRYIEENMWRAIRYGMEGRMIDFEPRRGVRRARDPGAAAGMDRARPRAARASTRRCRTRTARSASAAPADMREAFAAEVELTQRDLRARGGGDVNEDEIREALKKLRVEDVLLQTAATLIDLAARRMGLAEDDGPKQLDQAKLAIDAIRALQPLMTEEQQAALREPLSQLQMAYAREAQSAAGRPGGAAGTRARSRTTTTRAGEGADRRSGPRPGPSGRRLPDPTWVDCPRSWSARRRTRRHQRRSFPTSFRRILLD